MGAVGWERSSHAVFLALHPWQKIRKCSLHTGVPHFRRANVLLFRCSGLQIRQRFLAVSGSEAGCESYDLLVQLLVFIA